MSERLVVITDGKRQSVHNRLADDFINAARRDGRHFKRLETRFSRENVAGTPENASCQDGVYTGPGGRIAPLGGGAAVIVLADPFYWFNLSRARKEILNEFYAYLLSRRGDAPVVSECALLICSREGSEESYRDSVGFYQVFCGKWGLHNRGVLRTAVIRPLP